MHRVAHRPSLYYTSIKIILHRRDSNLLWWLTGKWLLHLSCHHIQHAGQPQATPGLPLASYYYTTTPATQQQGVTWAGRSGQDHRPNFIFKVALKFDFSGSTVLSCVEKSVAMLVHCWGTSSLVQSTIEPTEKQSSANDFDENITHLDTDYTP